MIWQLTRQKAVASVAEVTRRTTHSDVVQIRTIVVMATSPLWAEGLRLMLDAERDLHVVATAADERAVRDDVDIVVVHLVDDARLRLVYARIRRDGVSGSHVVLAYYPAAEAEPLLLDNLDARILPASRREDLSPLLSFNAHDIRRERQNAVRVGEDALARWNGLWRAASQDPSIRFLTPAQRDAPQCRRLRARAAWCT